MCIDIFFPTKISLKKTPDKKIERGFTVSFMKIEETAS